MLAALGLLTGVYLVSSSLAGVDAGTQAGLTTWAKGVDDASWTMLALMFFASALFALGGRPLERSLVAMVAAGLAFEWLVFAPPGPWMKLAAVVVVALLVPWREKEWERTPTLLDDCLPEHDFRGVVSMRIDAPPAAILRAFRAVTAAEMPLASVLVRLWDLPSRLVASPAPRPTPRPLLEELRAHMNAVFAERPEREIVIGIVGRLHHLVDRRALGRHTSFFTFAQPNHERLAMSLRVVEGEGAARVVFEHRTQALDPAAWWKFALYWWLLVKWGSAVMTWLLLRAVKRRAEAERTDGATRGATRQLPQPREA